MKRDQAEEKEADRLVHLQELLRERAVLADQRRQLAEEEQVRPVAMGVGVQEPEDRLGQHEGVERVFAPLRREPHRLRHVSRPVGEARELAPNEPTERHDPHGHAKRTMQLDECNGLLLGRREIDREGEHEDRGDEERGQPVKEPDHRVENEQFGILIGPQHPNTSLSCLARLAGVEIESPAHLFPRLLTPVPNSGDRVPLLRGGRTDTNLLPRQSPRRGSCVAGLIVGAQQQ